jgi:hypothetical protein
MLESVVKLLTDRRDASFVQMKSWVASVESNSTSNAQSAKDILYNDTVKYTQISIALELIAATRGLNPTVIKMLVDKHYRDVLDMDEDDNYIPKV